MIVRIPRLVPLLLLLPLWATLATARPEHPEPRPCLVPPVPQKKALPPPLGGAADPDRIFRGYAKRSMGVRAGALPPLAEYVP